MAELAPHDLTSAWSHLTYIAAASSQFNTTSLAAFQAFTATSSYWIGTGSGVDWLRMDLGIGATGVLTSYTVTVNSVPEAARAPKTWTLEGSNDASAWTTLDTQASQTTWTSGETRTFTPSGSTAYRYFRINITANNGDATYTQIAELYLIGTQTTAQTADFAPHNMSAASTPSPFVASASSTFSTEAAWHIFDGSLSTQWIGTGSGVDSVKLDTGSGNLYILQGYAIASPNVARAVKNWTMEGSNDNSSWDTLDTVTNSTSWAADERRTFTSDVATTGYRYFRLNITANNGDATYTQISELYLYGAAPPAPSGTILLTNRGMDGGMRPLLYGGTNG